jgi:hypothetical protein
LRFAWDLELGFGTSSDCSFWNLAIAICPVFGP